MDPRNALDIQIFPEVRYLNPPKDLIQKTSKKGGFGCLEMMTWKRNFLSWQVLNNPPPNVAIRTTPYIANGPWKKSLNFIFPIKYVIPKSLKGWPLAK